jgi:hypothetical protein
MLIMAIIGTLTPTLFYQTYGNVRTSTHIHISSGMTSECPLPLQFQLVCEGCRDRTSPGGSWGCQHCSYEHPDPANDPFYQSTVKTLMYLCAGVLLFVGPSIHRDTYQCTIHPLYSLISLVFGSRSAHTPRRYGKTLNSYCTLTSRVACHCTIRSSHHPISSLACQSQGRETQARRVPSRASL